MNALLGAAGMGDIGIHFPDTDPRTKGVSSARLLERVLKMVGEGRLALVNADITVIAQKPRLAPFFKKMRKNLAGLLRVAEDEINLKAVTTEGLGWIGGGRGMAAAAVVLLRKTARRR